MPIKFEPDSYRYEGRGVGRKQILVKNYMKAQSKETLFRYLNNPSGKPKIKQKCLNELNRRGIKVVWKEEPKLDLGGLR